jgi:hypothetical protein
VKTAAFCVGDFFYNMEVEMGLNYKEFAVILLNYINTKAVV